MTISMPKQAITLTWKPCSEERYYEMLGVIPPAAQGDSGSFMVGEPMDFARGGYTFAAFKMDSDGNYFEASDSLTFREFKAEFPKAKYYYTN